jgi:superfamily II DNA/RNA helicase
VEETTERFEDLGLSDEVLAAVAESGYQSPTPIQQKSIPLVLRGVDLMGCAQTGTGKTAAYALPIIDILSGGVGKPRMPRCLILAPTRELAQQIAANFETYGTKNTLRQALLIGGEGFSLQEAALNKDPDILIATPGRLMDMFERGRIMMSNVKILVIDEADRMLDMGFIPDVEKIVKTLPRMRQTLMFSATLSPEIKRLADAFLIHPKEVSVTPTATVASTVEHTMIAVDPSEKRSVLLKLIRDDAVQSALVFCNRKKDVSLVCDELRRKGLNARALHGDMVQYLRTETLAAFKDGTTNLLICSDVAGRGLDIEAVSHVFNFDVPNNPEDYVHRIGRTGRAGREGRAITLVTPEEAEAVGAIAKLIQREVPIVTPDGEPAELDMTVRPRGKSRRPRRRRDEPATKSTPAPTPAAQPERARPKREPARSADASEGGRRRRTEAPEKRRRESSRKEPAAKDEPVTGMGDHVPDFISDPMPSWGGEAKS